MAKESERKTVNPACFYNRDYQKEIASYASDILNPDGDDQLSQNRRILVQAMRKNIKTDEAKCLELRYGQGLAFREISVRLNIGPAVVSRIVQRCADRIDDILSIGLELLGDELYKG